MVFVCSFSCFVQFSSEICVWMKKKIQYRTKATIIIVLARATRRVSRALLLCHSTFLFSYFRKQKPKKRRILNDAKEMRDYFRLFYSIVHNGFSSLICPLCFWQIRLVFISISWNWALRECIKVKKLNTYFTSLFC